MGLGEYCADGEADDVASLNAQFGHQPEMIIDEVLQCIGQLAPLRGAVPAIVHRKDAKLAAQPAAEFLP